MVALGSIFDLSIPLLEIFIRGTVTFIALLVMMRVVGQRESGGLGITDVLLVVLVAQAAAVGLHGGASSIADGVLLVATILFWSIAFDALAYRWPRLGRFIKAQPRLLIKDGELNPPVLRRELMTREEVLSQLRLHGIEDPAEVERAYIEPNGMISIVRRDRSEPDEPVRSDVVP
jgi:uncharacterized membrane protein YcaP (DUF421 family)